jgi:AcrR family transcriptional regulator
VAVKLFIRHGIKLADTAKKRGRPRAYDPDLALERARDVFWDGGFAASSLDDLGEAMSMTRPSLYLAFGDKEQLYLKTLERYRDESLAGLRNALDPDRPLSECLRLVYASALSTYMAGASGARGCLLIGTAATESVSNAQVREVLGASLIAFDKAFEDRFRIAQARGELNPNMDVTALSRMASAVLHTLAVRARAGEPAAALEAIAEAGVRMICGSGVLPKSGSKNHQI